ncbi:hypothetical protein [Agaribacter flavus]|uniref:ABC-2 type transport system permease protein n=1 Tax=Agaribacter flavus TaxID=1902781 RepID=A0ABV7FLF7_9ALTE
MNVSSFIIAVQREFWEFKRMVVWQPIIIALLALSMLALGAVSLDSYQIKRLEEVLLIQNSADWSNYSLIVFSGILMLFLPFVVTMIFAQFSYFTHCLYDDRKDLSVMFWRSLPFSDLKTLAVKVFMGALCIPLVFVTVFAVLVLLVWLISGVLAVTFLNDQVEVLKRMLEAGVFSTLGLIYLHIVPFFLWLFPVYTWLLMASAYANKAPALWAILPILTVFLLEFMAESLFGIDVAYLSNTLSDYFGLVTFYDKKGIIFIQNSQIVLEAFSWFDAIMAKVSVYSLILGGVFWYIAYWIRANKSIQ